MEEVHGTLVGLDIHKKTVVVVVLDSEHPDEDCAAGVFGTTRYGLSELIGFLRQHGVTHAAMESTAQYWRPVWMALEGQFTRLRCEIRKRTQRVCLNVGQAATVNSLWMNFSCPITSFFASHLTRPLLIMCMVSIPCSVFHAVPNEP